MGWGSARFMPSSGPPSRSNQEGARSHHTDPPRKWPTASFFSTTHSRGGLVHRGNFGGNIHIRSKSCKLASLQACKLARDLTKHRKWLYLKGRKAFRLSHKLSKKKDQ